MVVQENNIKDKEVVLDIYKKCPELTFNNIGYQYLSKEIQDKYAKEIKTIETILKKYIEGFSEFNNFKPRLENNSVVIRCQYYWGNGFTGVGYFKIDDIFHQDNTN